MFYGSYILGLGIVVVLICSSQASISFKFTNLKCEDHDVSFSNFTTCKLSVIRRGVVSLNIKVDLYKTPVTNITVNAAIYKRTNANVPFLYNVTHDACAFFANREKYPIFKMLFSSFVKNSNMNHTCPYNDAIMVKDLVLDEVALRLIPGLRGQFVLKVKVLAYNDLKATVQVMISSSECYRC